MPADAFDNALAQLKNLKMYLATNTNLKDKRSLEVVMLISMARQVRFDIFIYEKIINFNIVA
jgi:hypothetical protein